MALEKAKETILNHMKKGETAQAISILLDVTQAHRSDLYDEAVLLASKLRDWERDRMLGTAGSESLSVREAQIDEAVINLALELTEAPERKPPSPAPLSQNRYKIPLLILGLLAIALVVYLSLRPSSVPQDDGPETADVTSSPEIEEPPPTPLNPPEKQQVQEEAEPKTQGQPSVTDKTSDGEEEMTPPEEPASSSEAPGQFSWGWQRLAQEREVLKFLLKVGGYTTEVTRAEIVAAGRGGGAGYLTFYQSDPAGVRGNWSVEKRKHPDEVIQFLNGPFRKIEEAEITVHEQNGALVLTVFSQPGTRRNAEPWRWERLATPREVLQLLNGTGGSSVRQAEIGAIRRNGQLNFIVFYQAGQPLHSGSWRAERLASETAVQRFLSDSKVTQAEVTAAAGEDGRAEYFLFYQ